MSIEDFRDGKAYKLKIEEMKKLCSSQCSPCVADSENCNGNPEKAKLWKCKEFVNGLTILRR